MMLGKLVLNSQLAPQHYWNFFRISIQNRAIYSAYSIGYYHTDAYDYLKYSKA